MRLSEDEFVKSVKHPVLIFDLADEEEAEFTQMGTLGTTRAITIAEPRGQVARLVVKRGRLGEPITIGRSEDCDIILKHPSISKLHAQIEVGQDRSLRIRDMQSRHGVFVNDQRIAADTVTSLVGADEVAIGAIEGVLFYPARLFRMLRGDLRVSPWRSLRNRAFAFMWLGQTISALGDGLYRIALLWWVLQADGTGVAIGALALCSTIPMLAFLFIGGVVVDRFPRARVMMISDLTRGIVTGAVALLAFASRLEIWHIYVAAIVFGLADAFFLPAYTAIVPQIVRRSDRSSANALVTISWQLGGVAGSALGAMLVAWGGTSMTFAVESASFFVCAACVLPALRVLRSRAAKPITAVAGERRSVLRDLREGLTIVLVDPWLWITILVFAFSQVVDQASSIVALPYLIENDLHAGVGALGLVTTAFFVGSVAGTIWISRRVRLRHRGVLWYLALSVVGVCVVCFGLPITIYGIGITAFVRGFAHSIVFMIWLDTLQQRVAQDKLGRVASIDTFGSTAVLPFAFAAMGWLTDHVRVSMIFIVGGAALIAVSLLSILHRGIRAVD